MSPRRSAAAAAPPRSLADELRRRDDEALADLLHARPDLAIPLPHDLGALAQRAAMRPSVQLAVDALDLATLQVLETVVALTGTTEAITATQVSAAWGAPAGPALDRLRTLALIWGPDDQLTPVRAAHECFAPYPAGLGPVTGLTPARVSELLDEAPDGARAVLDRLTWDGPRGQVAHADRPVDEASQAPLEWLLARGLLAVADSEHVVVPREVALRLRAGRTQIGRAHV